MLKIPFKFRITAVIFILAAIVLGVVLSQSLSQYLKGSQEQISEQQHATLDLLSEFARIALLTTDYDLFQPQLENVANLPGVSVIILVDDNGLIVATSEPTLIGHSISEQHIKVSDGWRILPLHNVSGTLGTLAAKFSNERSLLLHNKIRKDAFVWSVLGLLFIALISLLAGELLTRRLSIVTRAAEEVSKGNLSTRVKVKGHDEVAELGYVFDIMVNAINTKRIQLEQREQFLSLTLDSIGDAVITTDNKGAITRMNPVAEELTGWEKEKATGKQLPEIFKIIYAQSREEVVNPVDKVLSSRKIVGLANHTLLISKDNKEHHIADSAAPIIDKSGMLYGVILVFRDITHQYQTEETLRRSQKMEAIGQLSGGIAHDFNNQLNIVIGYLDFLESHFNEGDKPYRWVQTASKATLRCMDLTRQLLSFSRRKAVEKEPVDLNNSFTDLKDMISRSVTPEIDVQYFLDEDLWLTEINIGEFQDAVINLIINARDAMPHGGKIMIETSNLRVDDDFASINMGIEDGDYVELVLSDTGTGIDKELLEHIFEPFFTTKEDGKGTGLGMAMVYGFVQRYDGYIKVYSETEVGTTIRIYLPRSKIESMVYERVQNIVDLPHGDETVLIVDDEIDLLLLADKLFTELGYKTQTAQSGAQALEILKTNNDFDLIFSDVVMPGGVSGYDLAEGAIELNPAIKILLTSGFTSRTMIKEGQEKFRNHLLSKPYRKSELAQRVRFILDDGVEKTV